MSLPSSVAFGGSRSISPSMQAVVSAVVQSVVAAGVPVSVGCCIGADAQVIQSALAAGGAARLSVFAAFGPGALGACSLSAIPVVSWAAAVGARVAWWAGGSAVVPLAARLIQRSQAVVASAQVLVLFQPGLGSLAAASSAVAQGKPVFAFSGHSLPAVSGGCQPPAPVPGCAGSWVPSSFFGFSCLQWQPAQASLFGF